MNKKLFLISVMFLVIINSLCFVKGSENPCDYAEEGDIDDDSYCWLKLPILDSSCWNQVGNTCNLPGGYTCTVGKFLNFYYCNIPGYGACFKDPNNQNYCGFTWLYPNDNRCTWGSLFLYSHTVYCYNQEGGNDGYSSCSGLKFSVPYIFEDIFWRDKIGYVDLTCPSSTSCSSGRCVACNECILNSQRCSGTQIQTCESYGNGCTRWSTPTDCQSGQQCYGNSCQSCVACNSGTKQCSGTQIEQLCTSYGNQCTRWTSTACGFGEQCQNGQCQQVTAGLCSQYNTWKQFLRNETGGHNACANPYTNCILTKIGSNNLFDHYCSSGNTIPIYRTMNISQKINLGGNLKEKFTVFLEK